MKNNKRKLLFEEVGCLSGESWGTILKLLDRDTNKYYLDRVIISQKYVKTTESKQCQCDQLLNRKEANFYFKCLKM